MKLVVSIIEIVNREAIYIWHFFSIQFIQIIYYYIFGIIVGSAISVFLKDKIHNAFLKVQNKSSVFFGIIFSSIVGILSPLCMYGTIPIVASFSEKGVKDHYLAAFMLSSILLNPQLIVYSLALPKTLFIIRILFCFICGILAGFMVYIFYSKNNNKHFFNFKIFESSTKKSEEKNIITAYLKSIIRNIESTGLYFLIGILLSALFQRYVAPTSFASIFGDNRGLGVLLGATIGVPLYICGGGTIPLLISWLNVGMSYGAAVAFMLSGSSTKITNLGALKMILGAKHFALYFAYVFLFAIMSGFIVMLFV